MIIMTTIAKVIIAINNYYNNYHNVSYSDVNYYCPSKYT